MDEALRYANLSDLAINVIDGVISEYSTLGRVSLEHRDDCMLVKLIMNAGDTIHPDSLADIMSDFQVLFDDYSATAITLGTDNGRIRGLVMVPTQIILDNIIFLLLEVNEDSDFYTNPLTIICDYLSYGAGSNSGMLACLSYLISVLNYSDSELVNYFKSYNRVKLLSGVDKLISSGLVQAAQGVQLVDLNYYPVALPNIAMVLNKITNCYTKANDRNSYVSEHTFQSSLSTESSIISNTSKEKYSKPYDIDFISWFFKNAPDASKDAIYHQMLELSGSSYNKFRN